MKNLLKKKAKKFNSKKGFTLVELIVGIMIMLIVVSASVRGISISYRSAMIGAAKNDAQSIAQRNCDIIMTAIVTNVENKTYTTAELATLGGMFTDHNCSKFSTAYEDSFKNYDMRMYFLSGGYDASLYEDIAPADNDADVKMQQAAYVNPSHGGNKKTQYYTVNMTPKKINGKNYQLFEITTYVYYTDKGYVTCEGEVTVLPKT